MYYQLKNRGKGFFSFLFIFVFAGSIYLPLHSQTSFKEGMDKFRNNKPEEALPYFEAALEEPGTDSRTWLFAGLCYYQLGRYDDGIAVLRKGLSVSGTDKKLLYLNLGNIYFSQNKNTFAEEMYTQALLMDPNFGPALLNRANTRVKLNKLDEAGADYTEYLKVVPNSSQKTNIENLLALLQQQKEAEALEKERIAKEEAFKQEQLEKARKEEEERRRRILQAVEDSLKTSAGETTGISAGAEGVVDYQEESELE